MATGKKITTSTKKNMDLNTENTTEMQTENTKQVRYFKCLCVDGTEGCEEPRGRYCGNSPFQAANKAMTEVIKRRQKEGINIVDNEEIDLTMIESTRGRKKRIHHYGGKRVKVEPPIRYRIGGNRVYGVDTVENRTVLKTKSKGNLKTNDFLTLMRKRTHISKDGKKTTNETKFMKGRKFQVLELTKNTIVLNENISKEFDQGDEIKFSWEKVYDANDKKGGSKDKGWLEKHHKNVLKKKATYNTKNQVLAGIVQNLEQAMEKKTAKKVDKKASKKESAKEKTAKVTTTKSVAKTKPVKKAKTVSKNEAEKVIESAATIDTTTKKTSKKAKKVQATSTC